MKTLILLTVNSLDRKSYWVIKKQLFSIIWCIIHTIILSATIVKIIGTFMELWLTVVLVYMSFYLVICSILLDIIIWYKIDDIRLENSLK